MRIMSRAGSIAIALAVLSPWPAEAGLSPAAILQGQRGCAAREIAGLFPAPVPRPSRRDLRTMVHAIVTTLDIRGGPVAHPPIVFERVRAREGEGRGC